MNHVAQTAMQSANMRLEREMMVTNTVQCESVLALMIEETSRLARGYCWSVDQFRNFETGHSLLCEVHGDVGHFGTTEGGDILAIETEPKVDLSSYPGQQNTRTGSIKRQYKIDSNRDQ